MAEQFTIRHRLNGAALFEGRFDTMRLCVEAAAKAGANLAGANLAGAYLARANLARANLAGAYLDGANLAGAYLDGAYLDGAYLRDDCTATGAPLRRATRSDGHEFFLWQTNKGWRVGAGCRWFTYEQAWDHWCGPKAERRGTPLGHESEDILVMFSLAMDRVEDAP